MVETYREHGSDELEESVGNQELTNEMKAPFGVSNFFNSRWLIDSLYRQLIVPKRPEVAAKAVTGIAAAATIAPTAAVEEIVA
ncbi:hypothetical protein LSTR_LSTR004685 [Laodelphax striatellus]|uniref:Uncharacterized protein n=1 Tax=Laodelphax striatellus TaxID=195883 RepID=A0A482WTT7_LAOST|nr:hypothetical protein LSTR_LSTR004685 [Laodelphax striatellus]